jgi:FtsP/CotA-like multicopper oxidase with cupredoxin domain
MWGDRTGWSGPVTVVAALAALIISVIALTEVDGGASAGGAQRAPDATNEAQAAPVPIAVTLGDLFLEPGTIEAPVGWVILAVRNEGAMPHTLALAGTKKETALLNGGDQATLDLGQLKKGTYELRCTVPGHADAGMKAKLKVSGSAAAMHGAISDPARPMSPEAMDETMAKRTKAFPAKTEGTGAQLLAPRILPDGTKQFDITTSVVSWEIEPGKRVEAWAYNGVVPGPTMKVAVGDKVRVVLHNQLPESTVIHFHGVKIPNAMDGVPDITQPAVKPGGSFTYEFVAQGPAVAIYHSHHDAQKQVPNGLFGALIVGDLPVPGGAKVGQELPMILNDAGTIGFSINGKSFPATAPIVAKLGEAVLVHYYNEGVQAHPMHLHGLVQRVIAKDGFPLPQPYDADTVMVGPGERYSVLVRADEPGVWAWHCHILPHAEREDGMFGMVTAMVIK